MFEYFKDHISIIWPLDLNKLKSLNILLNTFYKIKIGSVLENYEIPRTF